MLGSRYDISGACCPGLIERAPANHSERGQRESVGGARDVYRHPARRAVWHATAKPLPDSQLRGGQSRERRPGSFIYLAKALECKIDDLVISSSTDNTVRRKKSASKIAGVASCIAAVAASWFVSATWYTLDRSVVDWALVFTSSSALWFVVFGVLSRAVVSPHEPRHTGDVGSVSPASRRGERTCSLVDVCGLVGRGHSRRGSQNGPHGFAKPSSWCVVCNSFSAPVICRWAAIALNTAPNRGMTAAAAYWPKSRTRDARGTVA